MNAYVWDWKYIFSFAEEIQKIILVEHGKQNRWNSNVPILFSHIEFFWH